MSQASDFLRKAFKEGDDVRDAGLTTPDDVERFDDILYGSDPVWQVLDVYRPKEASSEKLPVIISIHGGGWVYGDKERYQYYCMSLAQRGFAVVNYTYRLAPEARYPANLEDTNLVAAWVIDHAAQYGLDIAHIFAVGDSAGANILATYAAICTNPDYASLYEFQVPDGFSFSAIALNCGAYCMNRSDLLDRLTVIVRKDMVPEGASEDEIFSLVSPVDFITPDFPPTLYMTCTGDFLKIQAPILGEKLLEQNIPHEFHYFVGKDEELGHVFHLNVRSEDAARCNEIECDYFRRFL